MTITRDRLEHFYDELLEPKAFDDYGPNGLQVEGNAKIGKIAFAVSATEDSVNQAVSLGAHALVVHHGLFWKFHGPRTLTGPFARRVFPLVRHAINLFAYHLPLDAHPVVGNAATLGRLIGLEEQAPFGDYRGRPTGIKGVLASALPATRLVESLESILDHRVLVASPDPNGSIRSIGIITGGANSEWRQAAADSLDAYITGEMSEHDWHESREAGIHMLAGGHNATEQFGIQALMEKTQATFPVQCAFIASDNPA